MTESVSALSMVLIAAAGLAGFAIPVALFIYFRKERHADILPFFVGCGVMLLFALILESAVHRVVLQSSAGSMIRQNVWLYALYGGLMAGLFEETGRWIAFKTVLRKNQDRDVNALMYGAGHGGFEAAVVLGVTMIGNLVFAVLINSGNAASLTSSLSGPALTQMEGLLEGLKTMSPYTCLIEIIERIFAVTVQISLSVLVWFAAKDRNRLYLYPAAILIHFLVDGAAVVLTGFQVPSLAVEAVIGVMAVLSAAYAKRIWNQGRIESVLENGDFM